MGTMPLPAHRPGEPTAISRDRSGRQSHVPMSTSVPPRRRCLGHPRCGEAPSHPCARAARYVRDDRALFRGCRLAPTRGACGCLSPASPKEAWLRDRNSGRL